MSRLKTRNMRDLNERAHREAAAHAVHDARRALSTAAAKAGGRADLRQLDGLTVSQLYAITAASLKLTDVLENVFAERDAQRRRDREERDR